MHSTLERTEPAAEREEPERHAIAAPPGHAAQRDRDEALRAALRGLEDALAQRRSAADRCWSTAHANGRTGGGHLQAIPMQQAAGVPSPPRRGRRPRGVRPVRAWRSRTFARTIARGLGLVLAGLRSLLGRSLRAMQQAAALLAARPAARVQATPAQPAPTRRARWTPFTRRGTAHVTYPKRRRAVSSDRSLGEYVIPSIPMLASIGVIALILTAYPSFVASFVNGSRAVSAPSLAGRRIAEAEQAARDLGLRTEVARVEASESAPKDVIIDQDPRPGARLEPGGAVRLVVSGGLRPPDVTGKTVDQARVELIIRGWKPNPDVETRLGNAAPNVVIDQRPGPGDAVPEKGAVTLVVAVPNLALGKLTRTSTGAAAPEAVDGQASTVAWPAGSGPSWLEIELGVPTTVAALSLVPAVERPGPAVIEVWGWDVSGRFYPLQLLPQDVADGKAISARLPQPAINVIRLRIATTSSASPLGWREISVLDR